MEKSDKISIVFLSIIILIILIIWYTGYGFSDNTIKQEKEEIKIKTEVEQKVQINEKIGELVVTGVEDGTCVLNEINLWSEPPDALNVVGKITNACPKIRVPYYEERDLMSSTGQIWYKVKSDGNFGWITDTFVLQKE